MMKRLLMGKEKAKSKQLTQKKDAKAVPSKNSSINAENSSVIINNGNASVNIKSRSISPDSSKSKPTSTNVVDTTTTEFNSSFSGSHAMNYQTKDITEAPPIANSTNQNVEPSVKPEKDTKEIEEIKKKENEVRPNIDSNISEQNLNDTAQAEMNKKENEVHTHIAKYFSEPTLNDKAQAEILPQEVSKHDIVKAKNSTDAPPIATSTNQNVEPSVKPEKDTKEIVEIKKKDNEVRPNNDSNISEQNLNDTAQAEMNKKENEVHTHIAKYFSEPTLNDTAQAEILTQEVSKHDIVKAKNSTDAPPKATSTNQNVEPSVKREKDTKEIVEIKKKENDFRPNIDSNVSEQALQYAQAEMKKKEGEVHQAYAELPENGNREAKDLPNKNVEQPTNVCNSLETIVCNALETNVCNALETNVCNALETNVCNSLETNVCNSLETDDKINISTEGFDDPERKIEANTNFYPTSNVNPNINVDPNATNSDEKTNGVKAGTSAENANTKLKPYSKMTNLIETGGMLSKKTSKQFAHQGIETDYDKELDMKKMRRFSIPCYFLTVLFGYLLLLGYLSSVIDDAMPRVVTQEEAGLNQFSEERAWRYLREIVGDGPRVAGTKYHLEKTADLKLMLDDIAASAKLPVHVEWQTVTGDNRLRTITNFYENATNIIALLEGESGLNADGSTKSSVLFNCHYDSRPTSPGASDNALFCAAMVEVLYLLSAADYKLKHNIVFLFNGAEEFPLMGSPGFLKHPWAKGVNGLVNLDSAGINCKSMLFQVTDARVLRAYSRSVPRPSAQGFGEVLFKSGIVPSDTDFRIFRDFAQIHGVDIAFSKQGHVYHTRHDSLAMLRPGVLQHSGDMLLALAIELGDDDAFYEKNEEQTTEVYWDYLNWFMLSYPSAVALWLDLFIAVAAVATVAAYLTYVGYNKSSTRELAWAVLGRLLTMVAGIVAVVILTALSVATTVQLRYLSNGWMVVPLYWMPFITASVAASQSFDAWRCTKTGLNRIRRVVQAQAATRLILAFITILMLILPQDTSSMRYIITLPLLLMSVTSVVTLTAAKRRWFQTWQHIIVDLLLATPALLFTLVIAVKINTLMLPVMGRSLTGTPDYLVAGLNVACAILTALPVSGLELFFSRIRLWTVLLSFSLVCVVISFVPLSPYRESQTAPALQRHNWFHSEIFSYDRSGALISNRTGIWFGRTEVNTPHNVLELAAKQNILLRNPVRAVGNCAKYTYCNMPMVTPRNMEYYSGSIWVEFSPPTVASPAPRLSLDSAVIQGDVKTFNFTINGPHHLSLALCPHNNTTLVDWSLQSPLISSGEWEGRPVYFVHVGRITYAETPAEIPVSFSFKVLDPTSASPTLDLAFMAHRTSHPEEFTQEYKSLLEAMPDYFNIESYLSTRYNYVF